MITSKSNLFSLLFILSFWICRSQDTHNVDLVIQSNETWEAEFQFEDENFKLLLHHGSDSSRIILSNGYLDWVFYTPWYFKPLVMPMQIELRDIDNNGFLDISIVVGNNGAGIAASLRYYIFILQSSKKEFCYLGCLTDGNLSFEDRNQDGRIEIVSRTPDNMNDERTITYNAFNIINCGFRNVDNEHGYPKVFYRYRDQEIVLTNKQIRDRSNSSPDLWGK